VNSNPFGSSTRGGARRSFAGAVRFSGPRLTAPYVNLVRPRSGAVRRRHPGCNCPVAGAGVGPLSREPWLRRRTGRRGLVPGRLCLPSARHPGPGSWTILTIAAILACRRFTGQPVGRHDSGPAALVWSPTDARPRGPQACFPARGSLRSPGGKYRGRAQLPEQVAARLARQDADQHGPAGTRSAVPCLPFGIASQGLTPGKEPAQDVAHATSPARARVMASSIASRRSSAVRGHRARARIVKRNWSSCPSHGADATGCSNHWSITRLSSLR
jgi:hypothetical protein